MQRFLTAESFKLRQRRMTWILLGILIVLVAVVYAAVLIRVQNGVGSGADASRRADELNHFRQFLSPADVAPFGYAVTQQLVTILGIVLAGAAVGSEFGWRTILLITAWTGARVRLVSAKLLVLAACLAVAVVVGFLISLAGTVVAGLVRGTLTSSSWSGSLLPDALAGGARTWLAALPYVFLAAALAMLGRSTTLGVSVGLAVLFLERVIAPLLNLLGTPFSNSQNLLLFRNASGLMQANGVLPGSDPAAAGSPSALHGGLVLVLYSAIFAAITVLAFVRRDLTE